jgi:PAS domain S-box-containing protein
MVADVKNEAVGNLLDTAPFGFMSFTDDGKIVYVNATLLERLGYTRNEVEGKHVEMLLAAGARIFYQTHFFPLLKLHGRAQEIYLLLRAKTGSDVGMLCNAVRRERDGAAVTDAALMEVVERRKFEQALIDTKGQLETMNDELLKQRAAADEANHAKSNFLAVMSHELRTPLNAIGGYVQLLEMGVHGPVSEAQKETLGRIDRSQRHLLRLINDVLNLSRIEAGRVEYEVERVNLSELVSSTIPMVEPQMAAKNIGFETAVTPHLTALADRDKAQQILLNLLTNAVKFTPAGGSICVQGRNRSSHVSLRVIDTGIGIPEEMIEKVFEPFVQVDASKSRSAEGTGLGLAISRDLARGMGGDLRAESEPGKGSTFELSLPNAETSEPSQRK